MALFFCAVFFVISLLFLTKQVFDNTPGYQIMFFILSCAVFVSVDSVNMRELFFWYTGAYNYTVELTISFFAIGLLIKALKENNRLKSWLYLILSTIAAFLASGGSLEITAPNCALIIAVLVVMYDSFFKRKYMALPAVFAIAGGIINAIAPGNFKRAEAVVNEGHSTVADAIRDTFLCYGSEGKKILTSGSFIVLLCLTFAVVYLLEIKIKKDDMNVKWLIFFGVGAFLTQYFTAFPVILGYHADNLQALRTTSTYEIIARMMYILIVIALAQFIKEKTNSMLKTAPAFMFFVIAIGVSVLMRNTIKSDIKSSFAYMAYDDVRTGAYKEEYITRSYVIRMMELAEEGSDLYIETSIRKRATTNYGMGLQDDPNAFVNTSAAGLYHLNSVTVVYN